MRSSHFFSNAILDLDGAVLRLIHGTGTCVPNPVLSQMYCKKQFHVNYCKEEENIRKSGTYLKIVGCRLQFAYDVVGN